MAMNINVGLSLIERFLWMKTANQQGGRMHFEIQESLGKIKRL